MPGPQLKLEEEHLAVTLVARDVRYGRISLEAARNTLAGESREQFLRSYLYERRTTALVA